MAQYVIPQYQNPSTGAYEEDTGLLTGTIAEPATYSATISSNNLINTKYRGILVHTNITRLPGSASTTWATKIRAVDLAVGGSGTAITIASQAARSASGASALMYYPGVSETAGALTRINGVLPRNFRVVCSLSAGAANATSCLLSLSYQFLA